MYARNSDKLTAPTTNSPPYLSIQKAEAEVNRARVKGGPNNYWRRTKS